MDPSEASALLSRAFNIPVGATSVRRLCRLWGGMGDVLELRAESPPPAGSSGPLVAIAKHIRMPRGDALSVGDARKKASYVVEGHFYEGGHAERLLKAGCALPKPLRVERAEDGGTMTIVMRKLEGESFGMGPREMRALLAWLAKMHAAYWGAERADAAVREGLQAQGTYWHLDTRPEELARMPRSGWEGRLRLAARAIDARLKIDPLMTVVHGDPKDANVMFSAADGATGECEARVYDFQYTGKGSAAKDLAYALCCASDDPAAEHALVGFYLAELAARLAAQGDAAPARAEVEDALALAFADLGRWMSGWGWWGHDLRAKIVPLLDRLDGGKALQSEEAYAEAVARVFPVG